MEPLTQQHSDLQPVQLNWGMRLNTSHWSTPVLWPLQTAKASAWSREIKEEKASSNAISFPCSERPTESGQDLACLLWSHWMPSTTGCSLEERETIRLTHPTVSVIGETHLELLHDSIVTSHHQNIGTFYKLLFKLGLYQTQISVLLSYSVQRNYDKEMLSDATQKNLCKQHPVFQG